MLVNPRACSVQPGEFYISSAQILGSALDRGLVFLLGWGFFPRGQQKFRF